MSDKRQPDVKHSFYVLAAETIGIKGAILLDYIWHWCRNNEAKDINFRDGKYWTFNTINSWSKLYPYMSKSVIQRTLKKLEESGYIEVGEYNKNSYDRTKWYTITESGIAVLRGDLSQNDQIDVPEWEMDEVKVGNGCSQSGSTIPVHTTSSDTVVEQHSLFDPESERKPTDKELKAQKLNADIDAILDYLNEVSGKSYPKNVREYRSHIGARLKEGHTVEECMSAIRKKTANVLGTKYEYMLDPDKLFKPKWFANALNLPDPYQSRGMTHSVPQGKDMFDGYATQQQG